MNTTLRTTRYQTDGTIRWTYRATDGTPVTIETVRRFGAPRPVPVRLASRLVAPAPTWLSPGPRFTSFLPSA